MNKRQRLSMKETMKPVIEKLREGKKSWSELKTIKVKKRNIPDKTLERLLKTLNYWGLASKEKETDYWVWYENSPVLNLNSKEYDILKEHSKKLLPTLEFMSLFAFDWEDPLYIFTKEHLKSYPEIYKKLVKLEKLNTELIQKISQSISDPQKRLEKYKNHPHQLIAHLLTWKPVDPIDLETRDNFINALKPDFEDYFPTFLGFLEEIKSLRWTVEMGTPLEGKCSSCPNIRIKEETKKIGFRL